MASNLAQFEDVSFVALSADYFTVKSHVQPKNILAYHSSHPLQKSAKVKRNREDQSCYFEAVLTFVLGLVLSSSFQIVFQL